MSTAARTTPLADVHREEGASFGEFAGWRMPMRFAGVLSEHAAVRNDVGVFDVSHLGIVEVTGEDATRVIAEAFTNDAGRLADGASQYTLCCDEDGGVVDDLIVYRLDARRWIAVPNAANTAAVLAELAEVAAPHHATVTDRSTLTAVLAVQGPRAPDVLDGVLAAAGAPPRAASCLPFLHVREVPAGRATAIVARTGYTGEPGGEIVVDADQAEAVWRGLRLAGAVPCGLGARDTLRLEVGFPLHGHELSRRVTPFEGGVGWAVKLDHGPFRGREALAEARRVGPRWVTRGLLPEGRRPVREGMAVMVGDRSVGVITSGTVSPTLGRPIALAHLAPDTADDTWVSVDVRGRPTRARVTRPPFVERDPRGGTPSATG